MTSNAEHIALERRVDALADPVDERVEAGYFSLADDRRQPGDDEVFLRGVDDDAGALAEEVAQEAELERSDLHRRLPSLVSRRAAGVGVRSRRRSATGEGRHWPWSTLPL